MFLSVKSDWTLNRVRIYQNISVTYRLVIAFLIVRRTPADALPAPQTTNT